MLDIDPKNLNNYIDKEAVLDNDWHAAKEIESTKEHPMEQFINDIISQKEQEIYNLSSDSICIANMLKYLRLGVLDRKMF